MRRYRRRRRYRRLVVRVELDPEDINTLIAKEYLAEGDRADLNAIQQASIAFVSDAFCDAR